MKRKEARAFGKRLREAMTDKGETSTRAKSGVRVDELMKVAGVTREMARRYAQGDAIPESDKMRSIADWLDVRVTWLRDGEEPKRATSVSTISPPNMVVRKDTLSVPVMDVAGSMGGGILAPERDTIVDHLRLSMFFIRRNLPVISRPEALRIVTGHGDSMNPTFRDGDPLIVDTGITSIETDAVYLFYRDDEMFVKRLQRLSGGAVKIISDNKLYEPETISREEAASLRIQARVLFAWRGERL